MSRVYNKLELLLDVSRDLYTDFTITKRINFNLYLYTPKSFNEMK